MPLVCTVRLYDEIIHELKLVDYLMYRWTDTVYQFYTTYINVYLAHHEIFRAKVGKGGITHIIALQVSSDVILGQTWQLPFVNYDLELTTSL